MRLLARYSFPGNVLELAHALTHAFVLSRGGSIEPQHLPITIRQAASDGDLAQTLDGELQALDVVAKRFGRDYLLRVLRSVGLDAVMPTASGRAARAHVNTTSAAGTPPKPVFHASA